MRLISGPGELPKAALGDERASSQHVAVGSDQDPNRLWCWLARKDSNLRSPDPESGALPLSHAPVLRARTRPIRGPFAHCFRMSQVPIRKRIRCPSEQPDESGARPGAAAILLATSLLSNRGVGASSAIEPSEPSATASAQRGGPDSVPPEPIVSGRVCQPPKARSAPIRRLIGPTGLSVPSAAYSVSTWILAQVYRAS
jgi:hypothetical protein